MSSSRGAGPLWLFHEISLRSHVCELSPGRGACLRYFASSLVCRCHAAGRTRILWGRDRYWGRAPGHGTERVC